MRKRGDTALHHLSTGCAAGAEHEEHHRQQSAVVTRCVGAPQVALVRPQPCREPARRGRAPLVLEQAPLEVAQVHQMERDIRQEQLPCPFGVVADLRTVCGEEVEELVLLRVRRHLGAEPGRELERGVGMDDVSLVAEPIGDLRAVRGQQGRTAVGGATESGVCCVVEEL